MIQVLNLALPFFGLIALGFLAARIKAARGTGLPEAGLANATSITSGMMLSASFV